MQETERERNEINEEKKAKNRRNKQGIQRREEKDIIANLNKKEKRR